MKTIGTVEATANLIYSKQIYQNAQKSNNVVVDGTPAVLDTVQLDCNGGNIQSIDLGASTANVTIKMTNLKLGTYVLVIKQHASVCKSVSFLPALSSSFDMLSIGASKFATIIVTWDGTTLRTNSTTATVTPFSATTPYGIGALVIYGNAIYKSIVQVSPAAFNIANWQILSSSDANTITYADTYGTGNTNLQTIVDYLVSNPYVDFKRYASIDAMIADITNQNEAALYLVDNVAIGTMRDGRATSGFAYFTRIATAANISSYNIIGQFSAPSTRTSFDNTIAGIPNNPTTVKTAIDELARLVDVMSTSQRYVGAWDASANQRFLSNGAYYDDLTKNPTIDLYNAGSLEATVLTSNWPSDVVAGHDIRIVNATTNAIIHETTIASILQSGSNTIIALDSATNVLQGHKIVTANKRADSGEYFIVTLAGTKTLDGKSLWSLNDRVMSNGLTWDRIRMQTTQNTSQDLQNVAETGNTSTLPLRLINGDDDKNVEITNFGLNFEEGNVLSRITTVLQAEGGQIEDKNWYFPAAEVNNDLYIASRQWVEQTFSTLPREVTYSQLNNLIANSSLVPGQLYLLTDYMTTYGQPVSNEVISSGVVEPLYIVAATNNSIHNVCKSQLYPQDIIFYKLQLNEGFTKGTIYRRIDTENNNDIVTDWRHIVYRRWAVNVTNVLTDATSYVKGDVVVDAFNNIYVCEKDHTTSGIIPLVPYWFKLHFTNGDFVSTSPTSILLRGTTYNPITIPADALSYQDYPLFQDGFNNYIKTGETDADLPNNVILGNMTNNQIYADFRYNTINTIEDNNINILFAGNIIDRFIGNTATKRIDASFETNIIKKAEGNEFQNGFSNNIVSDQIRRTTISLAIANTIETLSWSVIEHYFVGNVIRSLSSCRIDSEFSENIINNTLSNCETLGRIVNVIMGVTSPNTLYNWSFEGADGVDFDIDNLPTLADDIHARLYKRGIKYYCTYTDEFGDILIQEIL